MLFVGLNDEDKPAEMAPETLILLEARPPFPLGFILWFK